MEALIREEITKVFGFSPEDSKEFMNKMDTNIEVDEDYFSKLLDKLRKPTIVEFPRKPQNLPPPPPKKFSFRPSFLGPSLKQKQQAERRLAEELRHKKLVEEYPAKLNKYQTAAQTENTLFINEGKDYVLNNEGKVVRHVSHGVYGYVKKNKKSPFIYKFVRLPRRELDENRGEKLRELLTEPFINCILQQDPLAAPFTCKLHKVYFRPINENKAEDVEESIEFIFKLEDLQGDTVGEEMKKKIGDDADENLKILFKVYGPLLEVLQALRDKYSFEHGDLHEDNIMFVQKPNWNTNTNLEVKMIDFAKSSLKVGNKQYGILNNRYDEASYLVPKAQYGRLPQHLTDKMIGFIHKDKLTDDDFKQFLKVFLDEYKKTKGQLGGERSGRQTRKHKSKHRKTRRN